jgi:hypothetical protein
LRIGAACKSHQIIGSFVIWRSMKRSDSVLILSLAVQHDFVLIRQMMRNDSLYCNWFQSLGLAGRSGERVNCPFGRARRIGRGDSGIRVIDHSDDRDGRLNFDCCLMFGQWRAKAANEFGCGVSCTEMDQIGEWDCGDCWHESLECGQPPIARCSPLENGADLQMAVEFFERDGYGRLPLCDC